MSMNKLLLQGRIPTSEKFRFDVRFGDGENERSFANFQMSVRRNWKPKDEQYYPEDIFNVVAYGSNADVIGKHVKRGEEFLVACRLQNRTYEDKNGNTVYTNDIIVDEFYFEDHRSGSNSESNFDNFDDAPANKKTEDDDDVLDI